MSPQQNHGKIQYLLLLSFLVVSLINIHPAAAHKVKISADVGGTLHIEPNDNPLSGEPTQAWFALTRKGGKVIPLKQCDCQLAVYAEPHTPGEPALLQPSLKPVAVERYQGIPGADIIFPKPGIYQLQLTGKSTNGGSFQPFNLKFDVTVATGLAAKTQNVQDINNNVGQDEVQQFPIWAIALPILAAIGIFFAILQKKRGSGE
jgi:hypothetical protein